MFRRGLALADLAAAALALWVCVNLLGDDSLLLGAFLAVPLVVLVGKLGGLYEGDELLVNKSTIDEAPHLFQVATLYALVIYLLDGRVVRSTLPSQLGGDFNVVAVAENATEAIELADEHQPDAALIDVEMPGGGARHAVPEIATRSPETCIVVLSADESREVVLELLNAGAVAYVRKDGMCWAGGCSRQLV